MLTAAHAQAMKIGPVKQLGEDRRDLLAHDAGPVVDNGNAKTIRLARRRCRAAVGNDFELDDDFRQDAGFLTSVQCIIDGFFDASEQRLAWIIEAEQMTVLGEKLRDGNLALTRAHFDGGNGFLRLGGRCFARCGITLRHRFRHGFFLLSVG